jgi:hypothetical protein
MSSRHAVWNAHHNVPRDARDADPTARRVLQEH